MFGAYSVTSIAAPARATRIAPRASAMPIAARLTGCTNHDSTAAALTSWAAARAATPSWMARRRSGWALRGDVRMVPSASTRSRAPVPTTTA